MSNSRIMTGIEYSVTDIEGNDWGSVALNWFSHGMYHGYLKPKKGYEKVANIFKKHDAFLSKSGNFDEVDNFASQIYNLKVSLTNKKSKRILSAGIVVVQETEKGFLLSCEGPYNN